MFRIILMQFLHQIVMLTIIVNTCGECGCLCVHASVYVCVCACAAGVLTLCLLIRASFQM